MVHVASLVVQPPQGITLILFLFADRGTVALVVLHTGGEFGRRVFRQIVQKSLFVKTEAETKLPDLDFVPGNGRKMPAKTLREGLVALVVSHN